MPISRRRDVPTPDYGMRDSACPGIKGRQILAYCIISLQLPSADRFLNHTEALLNSIANPPVTCAILATHALPYCCATTLVRARPACASYVSNMSQPASFFVNSADECNRIACMHLRHDMIESPMHATGRHCARA